MKRGKVLRSGRPSPAKAWLLGIVIAVVAVGAGALLVRVGAQLLLTAQMQILCSRTGNEMHTRKFEGQWSASCDFTKAGSIQVAEDVAAELERDGWKPARSRNENSRVFDRRTLFVPSSATVNSLGVTFYF